MSRYTARIHALNLVFQFPFHPEWDQMRLKEITAEYLAGLPDLQGLVRGISPKPDDRVFIEQETLNTFANLAQIDNIIEERLKNWELNRIAKIDLALLRLAVYEIRYSPDIPQGTAINEAIELAKIYGTDESPTFINGVLGQVVKSSDDG